MATARVSIVGVSGYAGVELCKLVSAHPALTLSAAVADRWAGAPLGERVRLRGPAASVVVAPMKDVAAAANAEVALLATPADVSARVAPLLLARGVRVVDLSGAFRLRDASAYPRWYGFEHPAPELLAEAAYGLPEVPELAPSLAGVRLVANPGCYATAAILAVAPLLAARLASPDAIFLDGKSGVTGAGRKVEERLLFNEVDENVGAYRVGRHQHTPEIEQALGIVAGARAQVTFTPHLVPLRRGLVVTAYGRLEGGADLARVRAAFARYYAKRSEVVVVAPDEVAIARVANETHALVGAHADEERRTFVAVAALDNLLKGAASQALQNVCAMLDVPFAAVAS
jgi:N-acetyl-gamma-glutamyl-phosphate reductase